MICLGHMDTAWCGADLDTLPERHLAFDSSGEGSRVPVGPCRIVIDAPAGRHVVVAGEALPRAQAARLASGEHSRPHRFNWEVAVPLDQHRFIAIGDDGSVPQRLHWSEFLSHGEETRCTF